MTSPLSIANKKFSAAAGQQPPLAVSTLAALVIHDPPPDPTLPPPAGSSACTTCGSPLAWQDGGVITGPSNAATANLHCAACNPPPRPSLVKRWLLVVWRRDYQRFTYEDHTPAADLSRAARRHPPKNF